MVWCFRLLAIVVFVGTVSAETPVLQGFVRHHRRFLRRLADLLLRKGPFSTMLGPSYPNHAEIFHFDFGPEFFFRL